MRTALSIALCLALGAGCDVEIPGESRQPRCEPRSTADPGRLNIDTDAEDFALADPCRASLSFYIAGNTPLRSLSAEVALGDFDDNRVASETIDVEFGSMRAGMFSRTVSLSPVHGHRCRGLLAHIAELSCRGVDGHGIECPAVRLKTSYVFEDFTIDTEGLDVCFD